MLISCKDIVQLVICMLLPNLLFCFGIENIKFITISPSDLCKVIQYAWFSRGI